MVKRQTVWLSTMMVLSLMLIGYYTMNNQTSTASTSTGGATVSTSVSNTADNTTGSTSHAKNANATTSSNSTTTSKATTSATASDWFTTQRTSVDQQMSQQIDRLKAEMANSGASSDQIAQASKELGTLESLDAGLGNATQAIEADGFKNAVIVPDTQQANFTVYVEASTLQKADVVKIMNIVSQQLDVSMLNVSVKSHA